LTARGADPASRQPVRVVLSNTLKLPIEGRLVRSARDVSVTVYSSASGVQANADAAKALRAAGVDVVQLPDHESHFSFQDVLNDLHARGVTHLLVEPGPTLTRSLFTRGQADRIWIFRSPTEIDPAGGLAISSAPIVGYPRTGELDVAGDTLTEYLNPDSSVFVAPEPSADFVLARDEAATSSHP
jgi:diaminohydroxyphosphoribosylaminopyrimidine deaminase/5-amino-6-(5-phosphoribosylamino)uracil reductase